MIRVHSFESMGTFDGPGIRLVVFMQGCPFQCLYCANPDTITSKGGKLIEDDEILRRAINERAFFGKKGGVTFSGGEPTLQAKELIPIVKRLKEEKIHVCIDTNGGVFNEYVEELFHLVDLVLLDIKQINPSRHSVITKHTNAQTLKTAVFLEEHKIPMRVRYVLVPGYTDFQDDLDTFGACFQHYTMIDRVEVLPYHTYGIHKYESLGAPYYLKDIEENSQENIDRAVSTFQRYFKNVWTQ